jgi:hypothetical protein
VQPFLQEQRQHEAQAGAGGDGDQPGRDHPCWTELNINKINDAQLAYDTDKHNA